MSEIQDTPESQETPVPWADAPENTIYYEKIYDDGHLGTSTESAEWAYKLGWFENRISKDAVQQSDLDGQLYRKEYCPMKTDDVKLADAKERKHQQLRQHRDQLRNTEYAEYDGDTWQIRQEDQENINTFYSSALAMKLGVTEAKPFSMMSATNTLHELSHDDIFLLKDAMEAKVKEIYARYWYARDVLLANAETIEAIEAIEIPDTIPTLQS